MTTTLGLDMSTTSAGYAVIRCGNVVASGVMRAPGGWTRHRRLERIYWMLFDILESWVPDRVGIEGGIVHNARAALAGGESRGIALAALFCAGVGWDKILEISPSQVKKIATGSGTASKEDVRAAMVARYGISEKTSLDASDAVAIAFAAEAMPEQKSKKTKKVKKNAKSK